MWLAVIGIHPRIPTSDTYTKQGPFPPTAFSCTAIFGTTTPSDALRAESRLRVVLIRSPFPVRLDRHRAREGLSSSVINPVHIPRPLRREVLGHCASKVLVPSVAFALYVWARLLLRPVSRVTVTARQALRDAADCELASLLVRVCRGASPVGSPLVAAASYRSGLVPLRAGSSPAGRSQLPRLSSGFPHLLLRQRPALDAHIQLS